MSFETNIYAFADEIRGFDYSLAYRDHLWNIIFPDNLGKWQHLCIAQYERTFYINHIDGRTGGLEVQPGKSVKPTAQFGISSSPLHHEVEAQLWETLTTYARKWLKTVKKNWIKANREMLENYPLNRRYGIVPNSLIRASLPDIYRLDSELGKTRTKKLVRLVETGYFSKEENTVVSSMRASDYFSYCRIAYIAGRRKNETVDETLSGREMYARYADGRHEGLLDIDENSEQEFADWIEGIHPKKGLGGHPWEIKRGGNTTHIDLYVTRPSINRKNGFKVELRGASISRMVETMKMFLAIQKASLPISIDDPEGVRKRLLAQDNIGIVPCYDSLHRACQHFRKDEDVYDVLYYDDLGRFKRRISPFITWKPLPLLKPRNK
ncbi:MAG: hypothetical protein ISS61_14405 [Desulfobacteraceae bacterium]|nr:hypothetical protein [Desulfobacteraceae bacterium]